jgi:diguanylate cyclase (GGDEF)-like protein
MNRINSEDFAQMQNNTHLTLQQESQNSVAEKTNCELLNHLFKHTFKIAITHTIASLIIIFWWAKVADITELIMWFAVVTFMSCFMLFLNTVYKKNSDQRNQRLWLHVCALCSALMGSIYGFAFLYFTPFDQAEYVISIGLFILSLSAVAVMGNSVSTYAALSFLAPIMLIPSYSLLAIGADAGLLTLLSIGFYALVMLMLLNNSTQAFKKAILVSYLHQLETEKRILVEQQLQDNNRRDGLTGLFNRRYFNEMLEIEIGRAHRNHQALCMLMVNIDCFKEFNFEYGHIAGDNCLVVVAETVQALTNRKGDIMARYGSEEFAIILPNIDADGALAFANKLQQKIQSQRIPHKASKLTTLKSVTISVGVTTLVPFSKVGPTELIANADAALYEAKRQGMNRVHLNDNSSKQTG